MYSNLNIANVAFDIDGTVVDFTKAFIEIAEYHYGLSGFTKDQILTYSIEDHIKLTRFETLEIVNFILEYPYNSNLEFIPGAKEFLDEIMTVHNIIFISCRHTKIPIQKWMEDKFKNDNFQVFNVAKPNDKLSLLKKLGIEYYFDDRLETCQKMENSGIRPILYAQPWNRMNTGIPTVFNWSEIRDLLIP